MKKILHIVVGMALFTLSYGAMNATAEPMTYVIDSDHTHVSFTVTRFGFADTLAIFPISSGEIIIDEVNPKNSSVIAKVQTQNVWSGLIAREDSINSPAFLNTEKYPEITFVSSSVTLNSKTENQAEVSGEMTILGQTHTVSFDVELNRVAPDITKSKTKAVGFSMTAIVKRSKFGNTTAAKFIGDDVHITIETIAHLQSASD